MVTEKDTYQRPPSTYICSSLSWQTGLPFEGRIHEQTALSLPRTVPCRCREYGLRWLLCWRGQFPETLSCDSAGVPGH